MREVWEECERRRACRGVEYTRLCHPVYRGCDTHLPIAYYSPPGIALHPWMPVEVPALPISMKLSTQHAKLGP
jgi:hypothetical protein